ncbi:MAG: hypothetical protein JW900_06255 [Anaerolineae bacterium]|nr:hypothetical protein [Anaerolineae bacterium]
MFQNRSSTFNLLSLLLLLLTVLTLICYLTVLVSPHVFFNPFPPPRRATDTPAPTATSTATPGLPPTFTPTLSPTITPTSRPTQTRTPTNTPTVTPTWPPTPSATPRATRSPWPFTCEVTYRRPEYGNPWSGVAGTVQDLDGNPLPGFYVRSEGAGLNPPAVQAGADPRYNSIYGSEAAWEQAFNPNNYQAMEIRVQLFNDTPDPSGSFRAVSETITVQLGGYASTSLGFFVCTLNWEEYR